MYIRQFHPKFTKHQKNRFPDSLLNALKGSMKRLGVDVVDMYQIHGPVSLRSIEVIGKFMHHGFMARDEARITLR
jgi:aryl-alcohol dehydrogenase-like predicted oxidoreductase